MSSRYDVVVIGSGYGGAIAASRLARAGRRVCLLERGREILTGDFPDTATEMAQNVQARFPWGKVGSRTGLFDVRFFEDQHVLMGCGLGGTSLINANVAVEVDHARVMRGDPTWPKEFRESEENVLAPYYQRARESLRAKSYPDEYDRLTKVERLKEMQAEIAKKHRVSESDGKRRVEFLYPPLAVTWKNDFVEYDAKLADLDEAFVTKDGVEMRGCTLCGDCFSGCNVGAKNTTQMTYVPDAKNFGAEIFCEVSVRYLERRPEGGWRVFYENVSTDSGRDAFDAAALPFVDADLVVLGAGSLGSTEILARSRDKGLKVSPQLGGAWSGNGGLLGVAYNCEKPMSSLGLGRGASRDGFAAGGFDPRNLSPVADAPPPGPCIGGMVKYFDDDNSPFEDYAIEDGSAPGGGGDALAAAFYALSAVAGKEYGDTGPSGEARDARRVLEQVIFGSYSSGSAMRHTQTLLGVCHDNSPETHQEGSLKFVNDEVVIDFPKAGSAPAVQKLYAAMELFAKAHQGEFIFNPMYYQQGLVPPLQDKDIITVHPLGGCQLGDDASSGVVNHMGQVFSGTGAEVYEDLLVVDGAVVPRSLAVNPFLTICAFAERSMELLVKKSVACSTPGWRLFLPLQKGSGFTAGPVSHVPRAFPDIEDLGQRVGVRFTECMKGHFDLSSSPPVGGGDSAFDWRKEDLEFCRQARESGRASDTQLRFILTAELPDIDAAIKDPDYKGTLTGTVTCPKLANGQLTVSEGAFTVFGSNRGDQKGFNQMRYSMKLRGDGQDFLFEGFKLVRDDNNNACIDVAEMWSDTSTLYVTVWKLGASQQKVVFGRAVLRIKMADFVKQMTTLKVLRAASMVQQAKTLARFGLWFAGNVWKHFGPSVVTSDSFLMPEVEPRRKRPLRAPPPRLVPIITEDGTRLRLTRYRGSGPPVVLLHPWAMDAGCYALDTIQTSAVEVLCSYGLDVFLLDWRASIRLYDGNINNAENAGFSLDAAAEHDLPAALRSIRRLRTEPVHIVAMCAGSIVVAMSLLGGHVDLAQVQDIVSMSSFTHFKSSFLGRSKAVLADAVDGIVPDALEPKTVDVSKQGGILGYVANGVLSFAQRDEIDSPMLNRINALFGPMFETDNLNAKTIDALHELFGPVSTEGTKHLGEIIQAQTLVDKNGGDAYMSRLAKLAGKRMLLVSGERDGIWIDGGQQEAEAALRAAGADASLLRVPAYGHADLVVGKRASEDVWKPIASFLMPGGAAGTGPQRRDAILAAARKDAAMDAADDSDAEMEVGLAASS